MATIWRHGVLDVFNCQYRRLHEHLALAMVIRGADVGPGGINLF